MKIIYKFFIDVYDAMYFLMVEYPLLIFNSFNCLQRSARRLWSILHIMKYPTIFLLCTNILKLKVSKIHLELIVRLYFLKMRSHNRKDIWITLYTDYGMAAQPQFPSYISWTQPIISMFPSAPDKWWPGNFMNCAVLGIDHGTNGSYGASESITSPITIWD